MEKSYSYPDYIKAIIFVVNWSYEVNVEFGINIAKIPNKWSLIRGYSSW